MIEQQELIAMGETIISHLQEKANRDNDLRSWRLECIISCEILLTFLKEKPEEREKILFLAEVFRDRYEASKPPAIPHWCRKISENLEASNYSS